MELMLWQFFSELNHPLNYNRKFQIFYISFSMNGIYMYSERLYPLIFIKQLNHIVDYQLQTLGIDFLISLLSYFIICILEALSLVKLYRISSQSFHSSFTTKCNCLLPLDSLTYFRKKNSKCMRQKILKLDY